MTEKKDKILILGAGLSGLTTAYLLAKQGYKVVVLEKEDKCGGLCKTLEFKDIKSDIGPHQICSKNEQVISFLKEILGDKLLSRDRIVAQYFFEKYVGYPLKFKDFIVNISPLLTFRVGLGAVLSRIKLLFNSNENYSFKSWVESRFGKKLYDIYFGPYTKKVWGIDPELLDPRTASSRIAFNSIFDYIIKSMKHVFLKHNDYKHSHSPLKDKFYYSKLGIGTFLDSLKDCCKAQGVEIFLSSCIDDVIIKDNKIETVKCANGSEFKGFDLYISTIPLTDVMELLNYSTQFVPLKFRAIIIGVLKVNKKLNIPYSWIYYPDPSICFQRLTDYSYFDKEMTPEHGAALSLEISCNVGDFVWQMKDDEIIARMKQDLIKTKIISYEDEIEVMIHRERYAYPVQVNGYLEIVSQILDHMQKYENFIISGRQGLYKYCDMDECIEMAYNLVNQIKANKIDYDLNCNFLGVGVA